MNAKISSSNKAFFWSNCKDLKWITLLQTLILFVSYPMMLLFANKPTDKEMIDFGYELLSATGISHNTFVLLIFPFLVGLMSFKYLQNSGAAIRIHSFPVSRKQLLTAHGLSGLFMLTLPYFLTATLTYLIGLGLPQGTVTLGALIQWFAFSVFLSTIFFTGTVFSGMIIGNSILQGVFTYILFLLPSGLNILISYHLNLFLKGYMGGMFTYEHFLSPMSGFLMASHRIRLQEMPLYFWIVSILYLMLFIGLSYWLYEKRSLEKVGQTIQFSCLVPYLKGLGVFCSILSLGAIFKEFTGENTAVLLGFILGAVVSYILFEMIIQRNLRCQLSYRYLLMAIVCFSVLFAFVSLDLIGYGDKKMPLDEIQAVEFLSTDYNTYIEPSDTWLEDPDAIKSISQLYDKVSKGVPPLYWLDDKPTNQSVFTFGFKDKNGHWFTRQYYVDKTLMRQALEQVYGLHAYLENRIPYLKIQVEDIESIRLSTPLGEKLISDPADIKAIFSALKADLYKHPVAALNNDVVPLTEVHITIPVKASSFPYKDNYSATSDERTQFSVAVLSEYQNTVKQINQIQSFSPLLLSSKSIQKILIKSMSTDADGTNRNTHSLYRYTELSEKDPTVIVIQTQTQLAPLLSKTLYHSPEKAQDFQVRYVLNPEVQPPVDFIDGYLLQEDLPDNLDVQ